MNANVSAFLRQENARLQEENQDLKAEVQSLREFVNSVDSLFKATDRFEDDSALLPFLTEALRHAMSLLDARDGSLLLHDDETNELEFVIALGEVGDKLIGVRIPADAGIAGWVFKNVKPTLVRDVQLDPRFYGNIDRDFMFRTLSMAAVPLVGKRKVYGIIEVLNSRADEPFAEKDVALLTLLCRAAGEALATIESLPASAVQAR